MIQLLAAGIWSQRQKRTNVDECSAGFQRTVCIRNVVIVLVLERDFRVDRVAASRNDFGDNYDVGSSVGQSDRAWLNRREGRRGSGPREICGVLAI